MANAEYAAANKISDFKNKQMSLNMDNTRHNLAVQDRNRARAASVESELFKDPSSLTMNTAFTNLIHANDANKRFLIKKKARDDWYKFISDPKLKKESDIITEEFRKIQKELDELPEKYTKLKKDSPEIEYPEYNNWDQKTKLDSSLEDLRRRKKELENRIYYNQLLFTQSSSFKKGGALSLLMHREKMENNTKIHQDKMELKERELFYKTILNNNKLLLESLKTIFK
jgi:hypothetical protein